MEQFSTKLKKKSYYPTTFNSYLGLTEQKIQNHVSNLQFVNMSKCFISNIAIIIKIQENPFNISNTN